MFNKQVYLRIENSLHTVYIVWINNSSHIQPLSKVKKKILTCKSLHISVSCLPAGIHLQINSST